MNYFFLDIMIEQDTYQNNSGQSLAPEKPNYLNIKKKINPMLCFLLEVGHSNTIPMSNLK